MENIHATFYPVLLWTLLTESSLRALHQIEHLARQNGQESCSFKIDSIKIYTDMG